VDRPQNKSLAVRIQSFIGELKRRKVFQVTSVYLVAAWGLSAGAADIFDVLDFPAWASRYFVIALFSLTPLVVVIAWVFELNRAGIQRDVGPRRPTDQTTILADRQSTPRITATWMGDKHNFAGEFVVGRDDSCALQIVDPMISRQHAKFSLVNGRWQIEDLASANGIVVDGRKVESAWIDQDAAIGFYPGGPELRVSINSAVAADTKLAKTLNSH